ncbi:MAG TPA: TIGR03905 family TSCPD domain-containing protein [Firmicutes bacterium]|nr:TIGR03905 family TSCPD domain-containing protein [Bacillota bacterium]
MEKTFLFSPKGVCSRQMEIVYDGDTLISLRVIGGCPGNLQGIAALVKGRKISELIPLLEGIRCREKPTSCPDQLAQALREIQKTNA